MACRRPYDTLRLKSGACRDFATLMIEAVRRLGYAARFVSGYLYTPWRDTGRQQNQGNGSTHAWVQVYLPDAGWIPFDPTNNLIGGTDLISVSVARHASHGHAAQRIVARLCRATFWAWMSMSRCANELDVQRQPGFVLQNHLLACRCAGTGNAALIQG